MAELWGIIYQHENYAELSDTVSHLEIPELDDIEFTIKDYDAIDKICSEIEACVQSKFVCGKENALLESSIFLRILQRRVRIWKTVK